MSAKPAVILKPGDRVTRHAFGSRSHGTVIRVAKLTGRVRFDGTEVDEKVYTDSLRLETAKDVQQRDFEQAMWKWRDEQPKTVLARVEMSRSRSSPTEVGASVNLCKTPDEMRHAAAELQLLADWFALRPQAPEETP